MKIKKINEPTLNKDVVNHPFASIIIDVLDEKTGVNGFIGGNIVIEDGKKKFIKNTYGNKENITTKQDIEKNKRFQKHVETLSKEFYEKILERNELNEIYDQIRKSAESVGA